MQSKACASGAFCPHAPAVVRYEGVHLCQTEAGAVFFVGALVIQAKDQGCLVVRDTLSLVFEDDQAVAVKVGNADVDGFVQIFGGGTELEHVVDHIVADDLQRRGGEIGLCLRYGAVKFRMNPAASVRVKAVFDIVGEELVQVDRQR